MNKLLTAAALSFMLAISTAHATASPDGTMITAPSGSLTTAAGTWTFGPAAPGSYYSAGQYDIMLNGVWLYPGYGAVLEVANGGQIYNQNTIAGAISNYPPTFWQTWNGSTWVNVPAPSALSPDGSIITAPSGSLVTAAGTWTFGPTPPGNYYTTGQYETMLNGTWVGWGYGTKLEIANGGQLYNQNTVAGAISQFGPEFWQVWNGSAWVDTAAPTAPSTNTGKLVALDTSTQGFWVGHYGAEGYYIAGGAAATPSYATVSIPSGMSGSYGVGPPSCLQHPDGSACNSLTYWNVSPMAFDIRITDGKPHRLSFYVFDLYGGQINYPTITDGDTGAVLVTNHLTDPRNGAYETFLVSGHVILWTQANGIFFDPPTPAVGLLDYVIASSGGAAVPLTITAPSEPGRASLTAAVASLPDNGIVTTADGTPVIANQGLSLTQLAGLKFVPATLSTTAASNFSYTVSDGANATTGIVPISVEVIPAPPAISSCAAPGYEQAGSVTSDSGALSVLVPSSGISPSQTGVLVNDLNVNSIITAHYFVAKHNIPPGNVFHFSYPFIQSDFVNFTMDAATFDAILATIPANIQMLALTWNEPYREGGNGFSAALGSAFFYNTDRPPTGGSAKTTGWNGNGSTYFNSLSVAPFSDLGVRPTMFVTGLTLSDALSLIDRGAAAQATMPTGTAYFVNTTDQVRSSPRWYDEVSTVDYWTSSGAVAAICKDNFNSTPNAGCSSNGGSNYITGASNVLIMEGGWASAPINGMTSNTYVPGAEVDLLTSDAGTLLPTEAEGNSKGSILSVLHDGATGSYGWQGEPTNTYTRFTQASILSSQYFSGKDAW